MAEINATSGTKKGYDALVNGEDGKGGIGKTIAQAYQGVEDAMAKLNDADKAGDPALLINLQMAMNTMTQVMSMSTQLVNALKQSCDSAARNL